MKDDDKVIVIGATNRPDSLDPALRRAGRFDREVCLGIPDRQSRRAMLDLMCKNLQINPAVSLDKLSELTPGYVGADLKSLTREAATVAANRWIFQYEINFDVFNLSSLAMVLLDNILCKSDITLVKFI